MRSPDRVDLGGRHAEGYRADRFLNAISDKNRAMRGIRYKTEEKQSGATIVEKTQAFLGDDNNYSPSFSTRDGSVLSRRHSWNPVASE